MLAKKFYESFLRVTKSPSRPFVESENPGFYLCRTEKAAYERKKRVSMLCMTEEKQAHMPHRVLQSESDGIDNTK